MMGLGLAGPAATLLLTASAAFRRRWRSRTGLGPDGSMLWLLVVAGLTVPYIPSMRVTRGGGFWAALRCRLLLTSGDLAFSAGRLPAGEQPRYGRALLGPWET